VGRGRRTDGMTDGLILYNKGSTISVDLTDNHPRVTRSFTNPIAVIALPASKADAKTKQYAIDLRMITEIITIDCILTDGIGSNNPASPSTKYEKLVNIMLDGNSKLLVWGPTNMTKYVIGFLSLNVISDPGKKDILTVSIKLANLIKAYGSA
jgi:hypothetical protein